MDDRLRRGPLLALLFAVVGLLLWGCVDETPCGELQCAPYVAPIATRAVALESTLVAVQTLAADLEALASHLAEACALVWDDCCLPLTATAAPPGTWEPWPTATGRP